MPQAGSPVAFLLGVAVGICAQRLAMGCFESKEKVAEPAPAPAKRAAPAAPARAAAAPVAAAPAPVAAAAPAAPAAEPPQKVFQGQYGGLQVTDADRAQLKLKSLRDKLQKFLSESDGVLKRDLELARRARAEGNMATCRVIMHRRELLKRQIRSREAAANTVFDMVAAMDSAKDQRRMLVSIEQGNEALNEALKDLSVERVEKALEDSNAAVAYTKELQSIVAADAEMSEMDLTDAFADLDALEAEQNAAAAAAAHPAATEQAPVAAPVAPPAVDPQSALQKAEKIPDVPADLPPVPVPEAASPALQSSSRPQPELA